MGLQRLCINMRRTLPACATLLVLLGLTQTSKAVVVLYSTGFEAPTYSDAVLNIGSDTVTPGQDGWLNSSGGGTNNITVANSAVDGFVTLTTSGQDVRRLFNGAATVTSGSVFFGADVTVASAQANGDYALHFGDGGTSLFYGRTYFKSSGAGYVMAVGTSNGTGVTYGSTVLNFGQSYHVLVRYDFVPGAGNDTGALFIDPSTIDGTGDTPYVAATTIGTDAAVIGAIAMRQGSASNAAGMTIDNYEAFINPVPEPTSMALAGIGLAGFVGNRLRRRKAAKLS